MLTHIKRWWCYLISLITLNKQISLLLVAGVFLSVTAIGITMLANPIMRTSLLSVNSTLVNSMYEKAAESELLTLNSVADESTQQIHPSADINLKGNTTELISTPLPAGFNKGQILYYDSRPVRPVRVMTMVVTAYSPDARSCAPFDDGITASGYSVWTNGMKIIAADRKLPFGTLLSVPGYNGNRPTPVLDRGAAIRGNRLDVLFPSHREARKWGRKKLLVTLWEYADNR